MGPLHGLVLVASAHRTPKPRRLFAIGQFLLFDRTFYERCGGHVAVAAQYPDDLALANLCLRSGGRFSTWAGRPFFEVEMYPTFANFIDGWRRNVHGGLRQSRVSSPIETTLAFMAMAAGGHPTEIACLLPSVLVLALVLVRQRAWGRFSAWGPLLVPVSLAAYTVATALALYDMASGGTIRWKGRRLVGWADADRGKN